VPIPFAIGVLFLISLYIFFYGVWMQALNRQATSEPTPGTSLKRASSGNDPAASIISFRAASRAAKV
jgi:hypothetical protein